jgi:hypothetical protein
MSFRSLGKGFAAGQHIAMVGMAVDLVLRDFNGDGRLDLAVLDKQNSAVAVMRGLGGGAFSDILQTLATGDQPTQASAMTAADVDGDGRLDLVVVSYGPPGQVSAFRGKGDGTFGARQTTQVPCDPPDPDCTTPEPQAVEAADFNCDGSADLVVANLLSSTVAVLLSNKNGTFTIHNQFPSTIVGQSPSALTIADFNRDGQPDFAVGAAVVPQGGAAVQVLYGSRSPCDGSFVSSSDPSQRFGGDIISSLVARDLNDDSLIDVAGAYEVLNQVQVFPVSGVSAQLALFTSGQIANVSHIPLSIVSADFDGDGAYDVATANSDSNANNVSVLTNETPSTVLRGDGNGDGKVTAADLTALAREIADGDGDQIDDVGLRPPQSKHGVDANGDGRVDAQDVFAHVARIFRSS